MTFDGKRIAQQVIDNGNQKRRGFTRACLGSADRICTSQSMMKHLRLNRRAVLKAGLGNAAHQAQIKVEVVESCSAFFLGYLKLLQGPTVSFRLHHRCVIASGRRLGGHCMQSERGCRQVTDISPRSADRG